MMGPVAFAEARLAEDEAAAKAAGGGEWEYRDTWVWSGHSEIADVYNIPDIDEAGIHISLHDPARALREVEAGRRILGRHWNCGTGGGWCDEPGLTRGSPCPDMADLLTRWADHPAYGQEWKP